MTTLGDEFRRLMVAKLDISEHLGLLRGLACHPCVRSIVEFGFRTGVSTTAMLTSCKEVITVDPDPNCAKHVKRLRSMLPEAGRLEWKQQSSLDIIIPPCDLLLIDSKHTYKQAKAELLRHHGSVRKWIALHDTETFAEKSEDGSKPGLTRAISEFLEENEQEWRLLLHLPTNNGLTVLERTLMKGRSTTPSARATTTLQG